MKLILVPLTFLWIGLVLGISLIEAPLKFQAPGITTELGLGIGKLVFTALNRVELLIMAIVITALIKVKPPKSICLLYTAAAMLLVIQTCYFLPALNHRAELIISGIEVAPSFLHVGFIIAEALKICCLVTAGCMTQKSFLR